MSEATYRARQVAAVWAGCHGVVDGQVGSGYVIAPGVLLTCAHTMADADVVQLAFPMASRGVLTWNDTEQVITLGGDLAIVRFPSACLPGVVSPHLGVLDRDGAPTAPFDATGFPLYRSQGLPNALDTGQATGLIPVGALQRALQFELHADNAPQAPTKGQEDLWAGLSGAAVWANGFLVAVVVQHDRDLGTAHMRAEPIPSTLLPPSPGRDEVKLRVANPAPGSSRRPPLIVLPPPVNLLIRRPEWSALREAVCAAAGPDMNGLVALRGPGGFGKTTLARAVCDDSSVRGTFVDGIFWLTFGQSPDLVTILHQACVYLGDDPRPILSQAEGLQRLALTLSDKRVLLVLDDVWDRSHLDLFLEGGPNAVRLATSRRGLINATAEIGVAALDENAAVELLSHELRPPDSCIPHLTRLAARLGYWPLLLRIVNRVLQQWSTGQEEASGLFVAITEVTERLSDAGVTAFDEGDTGGLDRGLAVARTIELSTERLTAGSRERLFELGGLAEEVSTEMTLASTLWGVSDAEARWELTRFDDLGLLRLDQGSRCFSIHSVLREFYQSQVPDLSNLHRRIVGRWPDPFALDANVDRYALRHLGWHLYMAQDHARLTALMSEQWCRFRRATTGSDVAFVRDSTIAAKASIEDRSLQRLYRSKVPALSLQIQGTIFPPQLIRALGQLNRLQDANTCLALVVEPSHRAQLAVALAEAVCSMDSAEQALSAVGEVENQIERLRLQTRLIGSFPPTAEGAAHARKLAASVWSETDISSGTRDSLSVRAAVAIACLQIKHADYFTDSLPSIWQEESASLPEPSRKRLAGMLLEAAAEHGVEPDPWLLSEELEPEHCGRACLLLARTINTPGPEALTVKAGPYLGISAVQLALAGNVNATELLLTKALQRQSGIGIEEDYSGVELGRFALCVGFLRKKASWSGFHELPSMGTYLPAIQLGAALRALTEGQEALLPREIVDFLKSGAKWIDWVGRSLGKETTVAALAVLIGSGLSDDAMSLVRFADVPDALLASRPWLAPSVSSRVSFVRKTLDQLGTDSKDVTLGAFLLRLLAATSGSEELDACARSIFNYGSEQGSSWMRAHFYAQAASSAIAVSAAELAGQFVDSALAAVRQVGAVPEIPTVLSAVARVVARGSPRDGGVAGLLELALAKAGEVDDFDTAIPALPAAAVVTDRLQHGPDGNEPPGLKLSGGARVEAFAAVSLAAFEVGSEDVAISALEQIPSGPDRAVVLANTLVTIPSAWAYVPKLVAKGVLGRGQSAVVLYRVAQLNLDAVFAMGEDSLGAMADQVFDTPDETAKCVAGSILAARYAGCGDVASATTHIERCKQFAGRLFLSDSSSDLLETCALMLGRLRLPDLSMELVKAVSVPSRKPQTMARLALAVPEDVLDSGQVGALLEESLALAFGIVDVWDRSVALATVACASSALGHSALASRALGQMVRGQVRIAMLIGEFEPPGRLRPGPEVCTELAAWLSGVDPRRVDLELIARVSLVLSRDATPDRAWQMVQAMLTLLESTGMGMDGGSAAMIVASFAGVLPVVIGAEIAEATPDPWDRFCCFLSAAKGIDGTPAARRSAAERAVTAAESIGHPGLRDRALSRAAQSIAALGDIEGGLRVLERIRSLSTRNDALAVILRSGGISTHQHALAVLYSAQDPGAFWTALNEVVLAPGPWPHDEELIPLIRHAVEAEDWSRQLSSEGLPTSAQARKRSQSYGRNGAPFAQVIL